MKAHAQANENDFSMEMINTMSCLLFKSREPHDHLTLQLSAQIEEFDIMQYIPVGWIVTEKMGSWYCLTSSCRCVS